MSKHRTLHDLVLHQLRDLHHAERHAGKMLSKMAKVAASDAVRQALERRHDEAAGRVETLEAIFDTLDKKAHGLPCEAMSGIIDETKTLIEEYGDSRTIDAVLLAAAQAMEHYAVARYTALKLWAAQLGLINVVRPLDGVLQEARHALDGWTAMAGAIPVDASSPKTEPMTLKEAALMGLG